MERADDRIQSKLESALTLERYLKWTTGIASAVAFLHSQGKVHRDLKANNILVDKNGNAKLCDFDFLSKDTPSMSTGGAISILAPEMYNSTYEKTSKCDIWSLSFILLELITLESPFKGVPNQQVVPHWIENNKWRPTIPDNCLKPIKDVIERCWKLNPDERPTASMLYDYLTFLESFYGIESLLQHKLNQIPEG